MKKTLFSLAVLALSSGFFAQKIDSSYNNTYYQGRMEWFRALGGHKGAIVFLGNSITERGIWNELLPGKTVLNRGIGGDNTFGVLARVDEAVRDRPKKFFLLIGVNDLGRNLPTAVTINNYRRIVQRIKALAPKTQLYLQSVLPLQEKLMKTDQYKGKRDSIRVLNEALDVIARESGATYINLHPVVADEQGNLQEGLTMDGIHLRPEAYVRWVAFLKEKKYL